MTRKQRKRLFKLCQDDPCCVAKRSDNPTVTIIHKGVKMTFSYDLKHECGSGDFAGLKLAVNEYTQPLHDKLIELVDRVMTDYLIEVASDAAKTATELGDFTEKIRESNILPKGLD